jgi:ATP-binding cassette subfamily B protein
MVQRAAASQTRINEFLETEPTIKNLQPKPSNIEGNIEFKNVSFTYPDTGTQALKNVSFTIEKGKSLAITGRTGSGKTTIAHLLARLYDVSEGEILIDGVPIREVNLYSLRQNIGFVSQDVFLFSDTIANNIAFGSSVQNVGEEKIIEAAKMADVYDNIMQLEHGFETKLGERGVTLSGGQKQRIAIARALVTQPQILILDDSLSAVDTETEDMILGHLEKFMKDRTTVIISHRISAIQHCDHILVLEDGEIIESGTHDEILGNKKLYAMLYEQQLLSHQENP